MSHGSCLSPTGAMWVTSHVPGSWDESWGFAKQNVPEQLEAK